MPLLGKYENSQVTLVVSTSFKHKIACLRDALKLQPKSLTSGMENFFLKIFALEWNFIAHIQQINLPSPPAFSP
jgi:hypothetical protein